MSLNYDLTKIENSEELCWKPDEENEGEFNMSIITNTLIWSTLSIGMNKITEANAKDFLVRCDLFADILGAPMYIWQGPDKIDQRLTYQNIIDHIGLSTNASTDSKTVFLHRILKIKTERLERSIKAGAVD